MTLQKMFLDLVKEAFDENIKDAKGSLDVKIEALRKKTFKKAGEDFQSLSGSQLDSYVADIRGSDYLSIALRQRDAPVEPSGADEKPVRVTYEYLRQVVPELLSKHGYVSAKLISQNRRISRPAGAALSRLSEELGITKDPNSKNDDIRYIPAMRDAPKGKSEKRKTDSSKPRLTRDYLQSVIPQIIAEHGYVSPRLLDPERSGVAGKMLSMFSEQLGITRDPNSEKGDVHYLSVKIAESKKKGKKSDTGPRFYQSQIDNGPTGQKIVEYIEKHGRLAPAEFCKELGLEGYEHIVAMMAANKYKHEGKTLGWEKTTENGRTIYRKPMLTKELIDNYATRILEVTDKKDRFSATDIDPNHPELFEKLMYSQVVGNGTFMDKEGLAVMQVGGRNIFYFKGGLVKPKEIGRTYNIGPDGLLLVGNERPDPDYNDRIGR